MLCHAISRYLYQYGWDVGLDPPPQLRRLHGNRNAFVFQLLTAVGLRWLIRPSICVTGVVAITHATANPLNNSVSKKKTTQSGGLLSYWGGCLRRDRLDWLAGRHVGLRLYAAAGRLDRTTGTQDSTLRACSRRRPTGVCSGWPNGCFPRRQANRSQAHCGNCRCRITNLFVCAALLLFAAWRRLAHPRDYIRDRRKCCARRDDLNGLCPRTVRVGN